MKSPQMPRINHFINTSVCFFRTQKRTYYILKWDPPSRKWLRETSDYPNLTLHRSDVSRDGEVRINVATYSGGPAKLISVTADGFYLKSGEICIPILKTPRSLGPAFTMRDYTPLDTPLTHTNEILWSIITIVPPPVEIPHVHAPPLAVLQEKIPKRIAWLIAEDASKTNETCPISTNIISPITASVTTCYHVFETESINEWVTRHPVNTPCPVCRKPCEVTAAFQAS